MTPVRIWIGLVLLALGVIGILQAAGAGLGGVTDWWPIAVIGLGLTALVTRRRATVGPLLLIALGFVLLADQLSWTTGSLFGPALLVVVGLIVLFGLTRSNHSPSTGSGSTFALFGGTRMTDRSEHLQRCDATAIAGSVTLDLRESRIDEAATVDAFALMGGVDVLVPHGWRVAIKGTPILGGVTVANEPRALDHHQDTTIAHQN
jgi:predicted membrane protein